jgi:outer membrane protein TolC
MKNKILLALSFCLFSPNIALSVDFKTLLGELYRENIEIKAFEKEIKSRRHSITIARSGHYPSISLNGVASKGKGVEIDSSSYTNADTQTNSATPTSYSSEAAVWSGDISLSYPLFSKFAVSTAVSTAKNSYKHAMIQLQGIKNSKRSHLIRLLLEYKTLQEVERPIDEAEIILKKVRKRTKASGTKLLFTRQERLKLETKYAQLIYQKSRVKGALNLGRDALCNLIPTCRDEWFKNMPKIKIDYKLPNVNKLSELYNENSYQVKLDNIEVNTAKSAYDTINVWGRPWIPVALLSSSYGYSGSYDYSADSDKATDPSSSWRVNLGLSFSLFSGFSGKARRSQAFLAYQMAQDKKRISTEKHNIILKKYLMDARNAKAEYQFKAAISEEKNDKLSQAKELSLSGTSTAIEQSILLLDYSVSKYEAYEALKKYQAAQLDVASTLNLLDEVKIYEK